MITDTCILVMAKPKDDPDHTEEDLVEDDHGLADRIELEDQDDEDGDQRYDQCPTEEGARLGLLFTFACLLNRDAVRQLFAESGDGFCQLLVDGRRRIALRSQHIGFEGNDTLLILTLDAAEGTGIIDTCTRELIGTFLMAPPEAISRKVMFIFSRSSGFCAVIRGCGYKSCTRPCLP
jgi:hypothetical protein